MMSKCRWILTLLTLCLATAVLAASKQFTLVIDAGHGGSDAGAIGRLTKEKAINLNVALAFGRYVERNCPDVKVIYTRKTDTFVELHTRADIANRNKADLFISIHTNSLPRGRVARGLETYTLGMHRASDNLDVAKRENSVILIEKDYKQRYEGFDPRSSESYIMFEFMQDRNMAQSVELAQYVQRRTCAAANRPNKGVKQAGFLVLRETSMPSCLIELGFISTPDEEQFLHSSSGVDQLARGIYEAFVDYKRKHDKNISVPYRAEQRKEVDIPTVVPAAAEPVSADTLAAIPPVPHPDNPAPVQAPPPQPPVAQEPPQEPSQPQQPVAQEPLATAVATPSRPIFKLQLMATSNKLPPSSPHFKGQKDVDSFQEGGMYKYTMGASTDYNELVRLRRKMLPLFPNAFVIAFKNGEKMDVQQAIREFRSSRSRR